MAIIISNGDTTLATVSGFYRVEAANLGCMSETKLTLSTVRYINTTFANNGNCQGIVLALATTSMTDRQMLVTLEEYQTIDSFNTSTEKILKVAHGIQNSVGADDYVSFTSTGTLPTDITSGTRYYVVNRTADDFQISTSIGGAPNGLSGTPTGTASVGVQRATKTLLHTDICGDGGTGIYKYTNHYFTPFIFGTPYAVDTTASKWRFMIIQFSGTGTWNTYTSDGTNPFYATWCDNAVSMSDNDVVIAKDYLTIDKTATLGAVLGTGDTFYGMSMVVCSNSQNPAVADVAYVEWENPPVASYTLSIGGRIMMAAWSGWRIGTETNRIPTAQRAIMNFTAPAAGTLTTTGFAYPSQNDMTYSTGGFSSLFVYGEIPTYQFTTLKTNAVIGQANLVCNDNVDWVNGDQVVIGKQNVKGQGVTNIYTVSSVSGDTITLTVNLTTYDRITGGTVVRLGGHGVFFNHSGTTYSIQYLPVEANLVVSGADLYNQIFSSQNKSYYAYNNYINPANTSKTSFTDIAFWTNSTSSSYLLAAITTPRGTLMQRCYGHRQNVATNLSSFYSATHKSGRVEIKDCRVQSIYTGIISAAINIRLTIQDCFFENQRASTVTPFHYYTGINGIFKNNTYWGNASSLAQGGTVLVGACVNPTEISGNKFNNNGCAISISPSTNIKCIDQDSIFGDEVANTVDVGVSNAGAFIDYIFKSPTGNMVTVDTFDVDMTIGGRYGFESFNDTYGDDRMVYAYGKTQRDMTTVHTSGGSSFRFEPTSPIDRFEYSFDVPTGNIQNKIMTIAVWCKINTATYYATPSGYELPRLNVTYDLTTTTYTEALPQTDWQLMSVTIVPTTTTGKITVVLSGLTDALSSDRYFYWDDIAILYPAGYKLDLGGLDIWDSALPVTPPIATVMSAQDVWAVQTSTMTGAGTVGKQVGDIKKDTGLIGALL